MKKILTMLLVITGLIGLGALNAFTYVYCVSCFNYRPVPFGPL